MPCLRHLCVLVLALALTDAAGVGSEPACCAAGKSEDGCTWNECPGQVCPMSRCLKCSEQNGLVYCGPPPPPTPPTPPTPAPHKCILASAILPAAECAAWIALVDATNGAHWNGCRGNRLNPCACAEGGFVECASDPAHPGVPGTGHITVIRLGTPGGGEGPGFCTLGDGCNVTGRLPDQMKDLTKLTELSIPGWGPDREFYGNRLTGPIPNGLAALTDLTKLFLGGNRITGTIPADLAALAKLTEFDVSLNRITGLIPELPWAQFAASPIYYGCGLEAWDGGRTNISYETNHYACPLPKGSSQCCPKGNCEHFQPPICH